jgi:hypothetical protein
MTGSLDFLPADYVCVHTRRMQARWRRLSLLVLTALVAWGVINESYHRRQSEQTRDAIGSRLRSVSRQLTDPAVLQAELDRAERAADELAKLELSVRPSRIYAAVTAALPADARLTHFHIASHSGHSLQSALSEASEERAPEDDNLVQVHLRGIAKSDALVARLVDQIEQSGLFRQVYVRRIEQGLDGLREFDLRLTVEPPLRKASDQVAQVRIRRVDPHAVVLDLPEPLREERP